MFSDMSDKKHSPSQWRPSTFWKPIERLIGFFCAQDSLFIIDFFLIFVFVLKIYFFIFKRKCYKCYEIIIPIGQKVRSLENVKSNI